MRLVNALCAWPVRTPTHPALRKKRTIYIKSIWRNAPKKADISWLVPSRKASDKQMRILCWQLCHGPSLCPTLTAYLWQQTGAGRDGRVRSTTALSRNKLENTKCKKTNNKKQIKPNAKQILMNHISYRSSSSRSSSYGCACFAGFSGTDCGHGPLCMDAHTNICQNGGTCK